MEVLWNLERWVAQFPRELLEMYESIGGRIPSGLTKLEHAGFEQLMRRRLEEAFRTGELVVLELPRPLFTGSFPPRASAPPPAASEPEVQADEQDSEGVLNFFPRSSANLLDAELNLLRLLPARYPPDSGTQDLLAQRLKSIESNFYPDLSTRRVLTAIVTQESWRPDQEARKPAASGRTVRFSFGAGTTVPRESLTLAPEQATTNASGIAEVTVTVQLDAQLSKENLLAGQNRIEVVATLDGSEPSLSRSLILTIHRNEDVDTALGAAENPEAFRATLQPVLSLGTWLVHQTAQHIESAGVSALQQLLNQVACRKRGANHAFVEPDGQFGNGTRTALDAFRTAFGAVPTGAALADYQNTRFGVRLEPEVSDYLRLEYGRSDAQLFIVDGHLLEGRQRWAPGGRLVPTSQEDTAGVDGLLDLYTGVVWHFISRVRARAQQYATSQTRWLRHPNDFGGTGWPVAVTQGVAYTYGGDETLDDFLELHPDTETTAHWSDYANGSFVGLHSSSPSSNNNRYGSAKNWVILDTDGAAVTTGAAVAEALGSNDPTVDSSLPANRRILHEYSGSLGLYTGIDCSAFVWRCCMDTAASFEATHCTDIAGQRIFRNGESIPRPNTTSWANLYREIRVGGSTSGRRDISFRGDVLNRPGSHIVLLDTDSRTDITSDAANPGNRIHVTHANGGLSNFAGNNGQCPRRVVRSPLSAWSTASTAWLNDGTNVQHGRIYLWR